jgi:glucan phosphoethanolaminetransferase (alkaline phosphatase superfamily)
MVFNLTGILGLLIFLCMLCFAILLFIAALLIKLVGKKQFLFIKLLRICLVFFVIGLIGFCVANSADSPERKHAMDDYIGWFGLLLAVIRSVFILLKKNSAPTV